MKKVIVTGGAGYLGSHTVIELAKAGYEPVIFDNFSNSEERIVKQIEDILSDTIDVRNVDCRKEAELTKMFLLEGEVDGVIHFAAHKAVGESVKKPIEYYDNNLVSLLNILRIMRDNAINNLVFSSSCTVYGNVEGSVVTEDSPRQMAASPYGNTKQIGEDFIVDAVHAKHAIKASILRYFNPIGAHPSGKIGELPLGVPNNLVPYITQTAAGKREKLTIFGNNYPTPDGTCIRDFIHVVDLANAHVKALEWLHKQDQDSLVDVFNIGTGNGSSVLELVNGFQNVTGEHLNYEFGERREGDVVSIYANAEKAERALNWKAEHSVEEALRDAWKWQQYLKNNW